MLERFRRPNTKETLIGATLAIGAGVASYYIHRSAREKARSRNWEKIQFEDIATKSLNPPEKPPWLIPVPEVMPMPPGTIRRSNFLESLFERIKFREAALVVFTFTASGGIGAKLGYPEGFDRTLVSGAEAITRTVESTVNSVSENILKLKDFFVASK